MPRDKWKWKHNDPKLKENNRSSSKMEVYNDTSLPQEIRNISNKQPNLTPKTSREIRTKAKVSKRE